MFTALLPRHTQLLGLGNLYHFFFYFYVGFAMKRDYIRNISVKNKYWILGLLAISISLSLFIDVMHTYWIPAGFAERAMRSVTGGVASLGCASSMIVALYSLANKPRVINFLDRHPALITVSGYCYGVYIYHQFILWYLYYKTDFISLLPNAFFPWAGFAIALVLSLLLCHLTLKTRFGRYLIG